MEGDGGGMTIAPIVWMNANELWKEEETYYTRVRSSGERERKEKLRKVKLMMIKSR